MLSTKELIIQLHNHQWSRGKSPEVAGPYHQAVYQHMKASYGPTYLTILSIIQGVATGDLAQVVASAYHHFTLVQWVLMLNTFVVLIIIWNVFTVQTALWGWIPDVRDGAVPFVVGGLELFLNHTISASLSAWLIILSLIGIVGVAGTAHIYWRSRRETESLELLNWLTGDILRYMGYLMVGSVILLILAAVSSAYRLNVDLATSNMRGIITLVIALLSTLALGGSLGIFHSLWRRALAFAQTDEHRDQNPTNGHHHAEHEP